MAVLLETTLGDLVVDLYTEERPRGEAKPGNRCCGSRCVYGFLLQPYFVLARLVFVSAVTKA